jgi:hypothetical protein
MGEQQAGHSNETITVRLFFSPVLSNFAGYLLPGFKLSMIRISPGGSRGKVFFASRFFRFIFRSALVIILSLSRIDDPRAMIILLEGLSVAPS